MVRGELISPNSTWSSSSTRNDPLAWTVGLPSLLAVAIMPGRISAIIVLTSSESLTMKYLRFVLLYHKFLYKTMNGLIFILPQFEPVDAFVLEPEPVVLMSGEAVGIELDLLYGSRQVYFSLQEFAYLLVAQP